MLEALLEGQLYTTRQDQSLVIAESADRGYQIRDFLTDEDLGRVGAARGDHVLQADAILTHAVRVNQIDPLLDSWNAVWDERERIAAHVLLPVEGEGGVIGANCEHLAI